MTINENEYKAVLAALREMASALDRCVNSSDLNGAIEEASAVLYRHADIIRETAES